MAELDIPYEFTEQPIERANSPGYFALQINVVDLTKLIAVEPRELQIQKHLISSGLIVDPRDIIIGSPNARMKKPMSTLRIIAQLHCEAKKFTKLVTAGPPGAHKHLVDLKVIGGIASRGDYPPRAKLIKIPFNGQKYATMAIVRSALCLTEAHGSERTVIMKNQVLLPALTDYIESDTAIQSERLKTFNAKVIDITQSPEARSEEMQQSRQITELINALNYARENIELLFEVNLIEPRISHVMNALDDTINYSTCDDKNETVAKLRMEVAMAFTRDMNIMPITRRLVSDQTVPTSHLSCSPPRRYRNCLKSLHHFLWLRSPRWLRSRRSQSSSPQPR